MAPSFTKNAQPAIGDYMLGAEIKEVNKVLGVALTKGDLLLFR